MEEIKKERTSYETWYKASDGTEFRDKEECKKYEESAQGVLRSKFEKLVINKNWSEYELLGVGNDDSNVWAVKMPAKEDIDTVMQLYFLEHSYLLQEGYSKQKQWVESRIEQAFENKDLLLFGENCDGDLYIINTRQDIIKGLMDLDKPKEE